MLSTADTRESDATSVEFRTHLQDALQHLTPRERVCTVLRFYDDLTAVAIAREFGITEGAVCRQLPDAASKLRGMLGDFNDNPSHGVFYAEVHETSRKGARP